MGITTGFFRTREGRKKSRIGRKNTEETTVVDLSSHISDANISDSSDINPVKGGGEKIGGFPSIITRGVPPD